MGKIIVVSKEKGLVDKINQLSAKVFEGYSVLNIIDEEICFILAKEIKPDFFILDLGFLRDNTKWYCRKIKLDETLHNIPIIAVCDDDCPPGLKTEAHNQGVTLFLRSSFDLPELASILSVGKEVHEHRFPSALQSTDLRFQKNYAQPSTHAYALHTVVREETTGKYLYKVAMTNPHFDKIIGKEFSQIKGKSLNEIFPSFNNTHLLELEKVARTRQPVHIKNFYKSSTSVFDIYAYSTSHDHIATVLKDVTPTSSFVEDNEYKISGDRSDGFSRGFIDSFSGEIRTPMNVIIGFSEMLESSSLPEEKRLFYLSQIKQKGYYMIDLIDKVADLSRIELKKLELNVKLTDIQTIFSDLVASFDNKLSECEPKRQVYFRINEKVKNRKLLVETDPFRLIQIFTELIANSLRHTDKGFIEAGYTVRNAIDGEHFEGECVEFYIKDTGKKLFRSNVLLNQGVCDGEKTDFSMSIGLCISQKLVSCLGGSFWIDHSSDIGSTYYFTIPFNQ